MVAAVPRNGDRLGIDAQLRQEVGVGEIAELRLHLDRIREEAENARRPAPQQPVAMADEDEVAFLQIEDHGIRRVEGGLLHVVEEDRDAEGADGRDGGGIPELKIAACEDAIAERALVARPVRREGAARLDRFVEGAGEMSLGLDAVVVHEKKRRTENGELKPPETLVASVFDSPLFFGVTQGKA
ncbi:MAG: hypothetical protein U0793_26410 [Gemmataceae bacterium]